MKYLSNELSAFPKQIKFANSKYQPHGLYKHEIERIVICGLGGSGIAGKIVKSFFADRLSIPVDVISSYDLPAYISGDTLVIVSSYSGNTEETLSMYRQAKEKEMRLLAITTGGKLMEEVKKDKVLYYTPEKEFQPRMALGYTLSFLFMIFEELLKSDDVKTDWLKISEYFNSADPFIEKARTYFYSIKDTFEMKRFIIVTDEKSAATGVRFCQQLQENAKTESFLIELPEACHNVLEVFYQTTDAVFIFLNSHINKKMDLRFDFFRQLLNKHGNETLEISFSAKHYQDLYEQIYVLDWLSLLIADYKKINSSTIENINNLKAFLSEN